MYSFATFGLENLCKGVKLVKFKDFGFSALWIAAVPPLPPTISSWACKFNILNLLLVILNLWFLLYLSKSIKKGKTTWQKFYPTCRIRTSDLRISASLLQSSALPTELRSARGSISNFILHQL